MVPQPNFLIIMADQMAGPAAPFNGHTVVRAPNLMGLAEEAVVFDSAYCASPLCAPSRAALMTGRLCSRIGAYDNAADFAASIPTLGHYLRDLGYYTCLSGKMHFVGPDQLHGFEDRLTTDIYPADFGWTPDWEAPEHRPSWYHNMLSVVQAGTCLTSNQLDFDEEVTFQTIRKLHDLARGSDRRPFCFVVSFTHPHDPYAVLQEYWDRYESDEIDLPAVAPIPVDQLDPHSRRVHYACDLGRYRQTEERVRTARHAYYGMISYVDDKVGQIFRTLAATGLDQNTIVIFTSDHGDMLGERGLWYKMVFFEWAARVPLFFHAPGRFAPRHVSSHVSLLDLLPTLVELAAGRSDQAWADGLDGESLVPLLEGSQVGGPWVARCEYLGEGAIAPCLMVRSDRYKYIWSQPDPDQLYDLDADPLELHNLAGRPGYEQIQDAFRAQLSEDWDTRAIHRSVLQSQRHRSLAASALSTGRLTSWDYQPFVDASGQYMRGHLNLDDLERRARFPAPEIPEP